MEVPADNKISVTTAWSTDPAKVSGDLETADGQLVDEAEVGAVLIDMRDEWIAGDRRYLGEYLSHVRPGRVPMINVGGR